MEAKLNHPLQCHGKRDVSEFVLYKGIQSPEVQVHEYLATPHPPVLEGTELLRIFSHRSIILPDVKTSR